MNKLLTEEEVAKRLEISIDEVKKLVDSGKLPAYKIAGQYLRFKEEEVEALIKKPHRSIAERIREFIYFYDFYIIAFIIILVILYFIFRR